MQNQPNRINTAQFPDPEDITLDPAWIGTQGERQKWEDAGVDPELIKPPVRHFDVAESAVATGSASRIAELRRSRGIMLGGIQR